MSLGDCSGLKNFDGVVLEAWWENYTKKRAQACAGRTGLGSYTAYLEVGIWFAISHRLLDRRLVVGHIHVVGTTPRGVRFWNFPPSTYLCFLPSRFSPYEPLLLRDAQWPIQTPR